jgi:hypothetical protein
LFHGTNQYALVVKNTNDTVLPETSSERVVLIMKIRFAFAILAICISSASLAQPARIPAIEQSIYRPEAPFENIKKSFYVRESERPLLDNIADASTSIARFLIATLDASTDTIHSVRAETQERLRLPPTSTSDGALRYVGMLVYCWTSSESDQLEFLIEWADITTNARYTDSYVFVLQEDKWLFDRHGSTPPWHWGQTERYFQRNCPPAK